MIAMSDTRLESRTARYAMFNNAAFADVVVVSDKLMESRADGTVTTRLVAAELRLGDSVVRPVMMRLMAAGLLDELPRTTARSGPRLLCRRNQTAWKALLDLLARLGADVSTQGTRRSPT
jgi:predicted transcriptional regulator